MSYIPDLVLIAEEQLKKSLELKKENGRIHQKPDSTKWSVLEIIDHLIKTSEIYLPQMERIIDQVQVLSSPNDQYSYSWLGKMAIKVVKPKEGKRRIKMKTFSSMEPSDNLNMNETFDNFVEKRQRLIHLLKNSRFIDHDQLKVNSAIGSFVKFKFIESFEFLLAHEERHILQARETLELLD